MTTLLNPKVLVFMGSFFAAMLPVESPVWVKAVVLAMFTFNSIWWHTLLAYALSTSRVQRGYGATKLWLDHVVGVFFVALGLRLAVSGRSS